MLDPKVSVTERDDPGATSWTEHSTTLPTRVQPAGFVGAGGNGTTASSTPAGSVTYSLSPTVDAVPRL